MLTDNEIERLSQAIIATIASPLIGSIEDYTVETVLSALQDQINTQFSEDKLEEYRTYAKYLSNSDFSVSSAPLRFVIP